MPAYAKVTGVINAGINDTFNTGDTINGATNAHDRVDVTVAATNAAAPLAAINNVEAVNFRTLAAQTINAQLFSGVQTVSSASSTNILTVVNGEVASTYALANTVAGSADGIAVAIRASDVGGANTTANFRVASVGTASTAAAGLAPNPVNSALSQTATGVENVVIDTAGNNVFTFTGSTAAATDTAKITITGAGNNTITIANGGMATTSTVTAATATGLVNLNVGTNLSTNDTFVGGTGTTDILRATLNGVTATGLNVSAFESFRIDSGAAVGTASFTTNPAFSVVREDAAAAGGAAGGIRQLLNAANITTLNLVGNSLTAGAALANNFSGLTVTGTFAGAADTLTVNVSNGGVTRTAGGNYNVANAINTTGVESYVVNVADTTANAITTAFAGVVDASMTSFSASSNGNVTVANLGTVAGAPAGGALSNVDFSGVTGTNAVSTVAFAANSLAAAAVVTAGASGLTVTAAAETATDVLTFNGSTGVDTLVGGAGFNGIVVANGAGGADVLSAAGAASSILNGGTGGDTLTGTNGGGTNSITGGAGADLITLGAGVDTLIYDAANQGGAALAANGAGVLAAGDLVGLFTAAGDVINVTAATTGATHAATAGALLNSINTVATGTVLVDTATVLAAGATAAQVSALIGTVTMAAGDSAVVAIETAGGSNVWNLYQVTAGAAHAGTALGAADSISLVGTYTTTAALAAANFVA